MLQQTPIGPYSVGRKTKENDANLVIQLEDLHVQQR